MKPFGRFRDALMLLRSVMWYPRIEIYSEKSIMRKIPLLLIATSITASSLLLSSCQNSPIGDSQNTVAGTEQLWIVDTTVQDLTEMVLFAAKSKTAKEIDLKHLECKTQDAEKPEQYAFEYKLPSMNKADRTDITLQSYAWNPANYAPLAAILMKQFAVEPAKISETKDEDKSFVASMADFDTTTLAEENKRLSESLTKDPCSADLHEKAALLCAVYALREHASCFNDTRPMLSRISAHLAMAQALRGSADYGTAGKLANATLLSTVGRSAEAMTYIKSLEKNAGSEVMKSWLRALQINASCDHRIANLKNAQPIELLEYGRILSYNISADELAEFLSSPAATAAQKQGIDWMRIGSTEFDSVASGHTFAENALPAEMEDFALDCKVSKGKDLKSATEANAELSLTPTRCLLLEPSPHLEVISWQDLSAFHARHILNSAYMRYLFEKKWWGVPEQADKFAQETKEAFHTVKYYPFLEIALTCLDQKKANEQLSDWLIDFLYKSPEQVSPAMWRYISDGAQAKRQVPQALRWFNPRYPFGTAHDYLKRKNVTNSETLSFPELNKLRSIQPYNNSLNMVWLKNYKYPNGNFTPAQAEEALGAAAEINVWSMESIAKVYREKGDTSKLLPLMEKIAKLEPRTYFTLGQEYADKGDTEKAKTAYETAIKLCKNSVAMSNNCSWLVNYYFDHKQKDKALELAKSAAEVYSAGGLSTLADLYERMGKLADAEEYFLKIKERYDRVDELDAFYVRNRKVNAKYQGEFERIQKDVFPDGMKNADASGSTPPEKGVRITNPSAITDKYGLRRGNIFVAMDGKKIETEKQYHFVRSLEQGPDLEFTFWNGKEYKTIKTHLPDRRLHCQIMTYNMQKDLGE